MDNLIKNLEKAIDNHFNNINDETMYQNLLDSGLGKIEPSSNSSMDLLTGIEIEKLINKNKTTYTKTNNNYKINKELNVYKNYRNNVFKNEFNTLQNEVVA